MRYQGRFLQFSGTLAILFAPWIASADLVGTPTYARVVTFNIGAKPWPEAAGFPDADCDSDFLGENESYQQCKARKIAARIRASDYDIVVLNEAFEGETGEILADELGDIFANVVYRLEDSGPSGYSTNSGLIIMSKWPLQDFTVPKLTCADYDSTEIACTSPAYTTASDWCSDKARVAFRGFGDLTDEGGDAFASKGVAYVRILHPSGKLINLFATHLQASYGELAWSSGSAGYNHWGYNLQTRELQLDVVMDFLNCMTTPAQRSSEIFLIAGDLNIIGDISNPIAPYPNPSLSGDQRKHNSFEWDRYFNTLSTVQTSLGNFFRTQVRDAWANHMTPGCCMPPASGAVRCPAGSAVAPELCPTSPPAPVLTGLANYDRGFTVTAFGAEPGSLNPVQEERLDYVLLGSPAQSTPGGPSEQMCAQHMTLAYNLNIAGKAITAGLTDAQGFEQPTSDHFGLNLELSNAYTNCNVRHAVENPQQSTVRSLPHTRGAQWYKISQPGTYSFNVNPKKWAPPYSGADNGLDYAVYDPRNLSKPITPEQDVSIVPPFNPGLGPPLPGYVEKKLKMPVAPFYVKVYHPVEETAYDPTYLFLWNRNDCASVDESCTLLPYEGKTDAGVPGYDGVAQTFESTAPDEAWFSIQIDTSDGCTPELTNPACPVAVPPYAGGCCVPSPDTDHPQTVRFFARHAIGQPAAIAKIDLIRASDMTVIYTQASPTTTSTHVEWVIGPHANGLVDEEPGIYYVRVTRVFSPSPTTFDYSVGWETNLTWLRGPAKLRCDESQEWDEDEIWADLHVDDHFPVREWEIGNMDDDFPPAAWFARFLEQASNPIYSPDAPAIALRQGVRFVDQVVVTFIEDDSGLQSGDETDTITIAPLGSTGEPTLQQKGVNPGSGDYMANYVLSHHFNGMVCLTTADCNSATTCRNGTCM